MKKLYLIRSCYDSVRKFYENELGVYTVMTALLAFPLLVLIGFTVDGTGVVLDKARLAQGMDQAALALVAENNGYRENKKHGDVNRQVVSPQDKAKFGGNEFMAKQEKRNQELIQGIAKLYLRSENANASSDAPITIDKPFHYSCEELDLPTANEYARRKPIVCEVQGGVNRKFWLPVSESLVSEDKLKKDRVRLESDTSYAIKEKGIVIPVELMLVSDYSGSMNSHLQDKNGRSLGKAKITILREVVSEISKILLPEDVSEGVSPFNRIGFTTFSGGVRQRDVTEGCVLPYEGKLSQTPRRLTIRYWVTSNQTPWRHNGGRWERSTVSFDKHYRGYYEKFYPKTCRGEGSARTCQIDANPKKIMDRALSINDWTTVRELFNSYMDVSETIDQISEFNGQNRNYDMVFTDEERCLGNNIGRRTTRAWFDQKNKDITRELNIVRPSGWTSASSGLLVGANVMMDENKNPDAKPSKLGTNIQRVILVLSDGEDNWPTYSTLTTLLNNGMCDKIREQLGKLQDPNLRELPGRIAFVAFGYSPPANQVAAWKKCVGDQYYTAYSKEELLDSFKQIIGFEEEVGRSSSHKPKF
ncbi:tight adherence protein G [Pasteurella multocida]|uniref:TadE/TadG family type IV pilus assembly protein n=1 Tax=Pasteurella multocida TaxID=747 RepID=UPI0008DFD536|nr:TadE/TadG family type IV pilus assembly protein [Pasteurella multocida]SFO77173.1 tight adherence protein G [Pasteurella multocida]VEE37846.1 protein TadG [Pasteurella multocida subsp. gallicida]HDR1011792.1 pilus assembly protein [Pasteurella multocida]HDR1234979.1 pilus assembly protein [Pasteurella multocida]HEA3287401.1 pilus assembly protein [Pasteurella multocida]